MTVRIYCSSDDDAPTLVNAAGCLIKVIDSCLVEGYGNRRPAGWVKLFSGTNTAVYSGVSGGLLKVDDTGMSNVSVSAYDTMSDINTGKGKALPQNTFYWNKNIDGQEQTWTIVANENSFYFYKVGMAGYNDAMLVFFGDVSSSNDSRCTLLVGGDDTDLDLNICSPRSWDETTSSTFLSGYFPSIQQDINKLSFRPMLTGNVPAVPSVISVSAIDAVDRNNAVKGTLPGIYCLEGISMLSTHARCSVANNITDTFLVVPTPLDTFIIQAFGEWK